MSSNKIAAKKTIKYLEKYDWVFNDHSKVEKDFVEAFRNHEADDLTNIIVILISKGHLFFNLSDICTLEGARITYKRTLAQEKKKAILKKKKNPWDDEVEE